MAVRDDPLGRFIRAAFLYQGAANGITADAAARLDELLREMAGIMVANDPTSVLPRYRPGRVRKIISEVREISGPAFTELYREIREGLVEVGKVAGAESRLLFLATVGREVGERLEVVGPSVNFLRSVVRESPIRGKTLADWISRQEANVLHRFETSMQVGLVNEESIDELTARMLASEGRVGSSVTRAAKRDMRALVRTSTTQVTQEAAFETFQGNPDVSSSYQYVATLDGDTTLICMSLDGNVYRYDDPFGDRPPQHWSCRSAIVPVVDYERLGIEPPSGLGRSAREMRVRESGKVVRGKSVRVSEKLDYPGWLRRQPKAVQAEALGQGRADLFRGGMSIETMLRRDKSMIPVADLRKMFADGIR